MSVRARTHGTLRHAADSLLAERLGRLAFAVLLITISGPGETSASPPLAPQLRPESEQSAERVDWWPKIEAIDAMLAGHKWKGALRQAERIADFVKSEAWSGRDLDRVLAELARQQAIAEINLGREHEARWHWYTALTLAPELAQRDLSTFDRATRLSEIRLRRLETVPAGYDRLDDLQILQLEPPRFPDVAPPDIVTNAAATLQRQPNVLVEAILDSDGNIRQPVVMTEDAHPILVYVALDWLSRMPAAAPARLEGRAVDSLQLLDVSFDVVRTGGQIFFEPPDNR